MRLAVVGHVEVVEFAVVDRLPGRGEIAHAAGTTTAAAGGGAVAAVVLRELAGAATLWTAVGDDPVGDAAVAELRERGVEVRAARRTGVPTRRGFTHLAADGERTITVIGERLAPAAGDGVDVRGADGVYVTAGDEEVVRAARAARVLVATPRAGDVLARAGVPLDVLVGSATDPGERVDLAGWPVPPRAVVRTDGARGGTWATADGTSGTWAATPLPGPVRDAYGCGDAFAAALTHALAAGRTLPEACAAGARAGAHRVTLRGPYG